MDYLVGAYGDLVQDADTVGQPCPASPRAMAASRSGSGANSSPAASSTLWRIVWFELHYDPAYERDGAGDHRWEW